MFSNKKFCVITVRYLNYIALKYWTLDWPTKLRIFILQLFIENSILPFRWSHHNWRYFQMIYIYSIKLKIYLLKFIQYIMYFLISSYLQQKMISIILIYVLPNSNNTIHFSQKRITWLVQFLIIERLLFKCFFYKV